MLAVFSGKWEVPADIGALLPDSNGFEDFLSHTLVHNSLRYVNVEKFEHILRFQYSICTKSQQLVNNISTIYLPFLDCGTFTAARDLWSGQNDLLFSIEDKSCYAGEHERSMFRPSRLLFDNQTQTVILADARPVQAHDHEGFFNQEYASTLRLQAGPREPHHVELKRGHRHHCRRAMLTIYHRDVKLKFHPLSFATHMAGGVLSVAGGMLNEVEDHIPKFVKNAYNSFAGILDNVLDMKFNAHWDQMFNAKDLGDRHVFFEPGKTLGFLPLGPTITCLRWDESRCTDKKKWFDCHLQKHFQAAVLHVVALEEWHVRFQLEVVGDIGIDYMCSWPLVTAVPLLDTPGCGAFINYAGFYQDVPPGKNPIGEKYGEGHPKEGEVRRGGFHAVKTSLGITAYAQFGMSGTLNLTLPGIDAKIPKSQFLKIDLLAEEKYQNTFEPIVTFLPPKIIIENPAVYAKFWIAPVFALSIGFKAPGQKYATSIGVRLDLLKIVFKLQGMKDTDDQCRSNGDAGYNPDPVIHLDNASMFTILMENGLYAWFNLFGFAIDSFWLGNLVLPKEIGSGGIDGKGRLETHCFGLICTTELWRKCWGCSGVSCGTWWINSMPSVLNKIFEEAAGTVSKLVTIGFKIIKSKPKFENPRRNDVEALRSSASKYIPYITPRPTPTTRPGTASARTTPCSSTTESQQIKSPRSSKEGSPQSEIPGLSTSLQKQNTTTPVSSKTERTLSRKSTHPLTSLQSKMPPHLSAHR